MADRPRVEVDSWAAAIGLLRHVLPDAEVTVSKQAQPLLPPDLPVRRSNAPWSVHKGARRVYREARPGAHLQIREYPDRWVLERDASNPHYRPVRHVAYDTAPYTLASLANPLDTTVALALYAPARLVRFGADLLTIGLSATDRLQSTIDVVPTERDPNPDPDGT